MDEAEKMVCEAVAGLVCWLDGQRSDGEGGKRSRLIYEGEMVVRLGSFGNE